MAGTLAAAESLARDRGQKLTPLRRRVLEIVLESHRPIGAYDVLAKPFDTTEVIRIVSGAWRHWLERYERHVNQTKQRKATEGT